MPDSVRSQQISQQILVNSTESGEKSNQNVQQIFTNLVSGPVSQNEPRSELLPDAHDTRAQTADPHHHYPGSDKDGSLAPQPIPRIKLHRNPETGWSLSSPPVTSHGVSTSDSHTSMGHMFANPHRSFQPQVSQYPSCSSRVGGSLSSHDPMVSQASLVSPRLVPPVATQLAQPPYPVSSWPNMLDLKSSQFGVASSPAAGSLTGFYS